MYFIVNVVYGFVWSFYLKFWNKIEWNKVDIIDWYLFMDSEVIFGILNGDVMWGRFFVNICLLWEIVVLVFFLFLFFGVNFILNFNLLSFDWK